MKCYDVKLESKSVGNVTVDKEGLYYRISCRCRPVQAAIYKLIVFCNGRTTDIGICVPQGDGFGLDRQIPVKRVGEGKMRFEILPSDNSKNSVRIPIIPGLPFDHISKLPHGFLVINSGCYEIQLPKAITEEAQ